MTETRRNYALLISAAFCAAALIYAQPTPGYRIGPASQQLIADFENSADADAAMRALHQQASAALASLQAQAAAKP